MRSHYSGARERHGGAGRLLDSALGGPLARGRRAGAAVPSRQRGGRLPRDEEHGGEGPRPRRPRAGARRARGQGAGVRRLGRARRGPTHGEPGGGRVRQHARGRDHGARDRRLLEPAPAGRAGGDAAARRSAVAGVRAGGLRPHRRGARLVPRARPRAERPRAAVAQPRAGRAAAVLRAATRLAGGRGAGGGGGRGLRAGGR